MEKTVVIPPGNSCHGLIAAPESSRDFHAVDSIFETAVADCVLER
jgi:hypothetical protein